MSSGDTVYLDTVALPGEESTQVEEMGKLISGGDTVGVVGLTGASGGHSYMIALMGYMAPEDDIQGGTARFRLDETIDLSQHSIDLRPEDVEHIPDMPGD